MLTPSETAARPYQRDDIQRAAAMLEQQRAVLLAHEPGLGKTFITLGICAQLKAKRILVLCPAVGRLVWEKEILSWFPSWSNRLCVIHPGGRLPNLHLAQKLAQPNVIAILSYDFLSSLRISHDDKLDETVFGDAMFDVLVLDEAHYLKTSGACRTWRVYGDKGLARRAGRVLVLSGTPAPNGPHELWTHLHALWPDEIMINSRHGQRRPMTEAEWGERVCKFSHTPWGLKFIGVQNTALVRRTLSRIMLRRTKHEVLPELPPVIARDVPLELPTGAPWSKFTAEARQIYTKLITRMRQRGDDASILSQLHLSPSDPDAGPLASMRRQLVEMKVQPAVEWMAPRLDNDLKAKMVIFGWHKEALKRLHKTLAQYSPVILTGETNDADRKKAIDQFQNDPCCRVFVGQIMACGTAVTLTAGTECVFLECAWTPGVNAQAISRLHRMGKRDSVLASFLYVPDSVDQTVMRVFRRKAAGLREFIHE